jgi:hypothetical protein
MLSKYIFKSNWTSLSSNYPYDSNLVIDNLPIYVDGNIDITYVPFLSGVKDYSNNNYSVFFLTNPVEMSNLAKRQVPELNYNKQVCVLANRFKNGVISVDTLFLKFDKNLNVFNFNSINLLGDYNFFEINFLNPIDAIIYTFKDNIYNYYLCADDINNTSLFVLSGYSNKELTFFEKQKIKFNYVYDVDKGSIIFYKVIQNDVYLLGINKQFNGNVLELTQKNLEEASDDNIFNFVKIRDLPVNSYKNDWVSYNTSLDKNDITINLNRSIYSLKNNYLFHSQYNNIQNDSFDTNVLTLKNQYNIKDLILRNKDKNYYRDYKSIFTGSNRESGYTNISLGYSTSLYTLNLPSDKTTWFHLPHNKNLKPININDSNFVRNGAVAGTSPLYSDKIWKRAANYSDTSNNGNAKNIEHSGRWLCAWLSGGPESSTWVDRFYNPDTITPFTALKYSSNVEYVSQNDGVYSPGITDTVSNLTLDQGCWYAYSRIGKKTSTNILSGLSDVQVSKGPMTVRSSTKSERFADLDRDGDPFYTLNQNTYGSISVENLNYYNNFSLSFFMTKEDWNTAENYQIIGNYMDNGFGFFNNNKFNPLIYYINDRKIYLYNDVYSNILTIDLNFYLSGQDFNIIGLFRRDTNQNFHVVTSNYRLLEFNSNGTLLDSLSFSLNNGNNGKSLVHINNNKNYGVILYNDYNILKIDLLTNVFVDITNNSSVVKTELYNPNHSYCSVIDAYNKVFILNGSYPILKDNNIYYTSQDSLSVLRYDTSTDTFATYLNSNSAKIVSFNFDNGENTYLLYKDKIDFYNTLGQYTTSFRFNTSNLLLTAVNFTFQDLCNGRYLKTVHMIDDKFRSYLYNLDNNSYVRNDLLSNSAYNNEEKIYKNKFDMTNYGYIQSVVNNMYGLPSYNFKIRLFNQLNYEETLELNTVLLGESLNTGTHHFCVTLDTLKGVFRMYVDSSLYYEKLFAPSKYSFSYLYRDNIVLGATPFYGGILFSDFYKSGKNYFFTENVTIEKVRLYKQELTKEEVKLLYFEKFPPLDLKVDLEIGERNYLDTISRTFKHKLQGSKSNLINLYINDSLIVDKASQKIFNSMIVNELKNYMPAYSKVNSITWLNNKENSEKMLDEVFNGENLITNIQS